MAKREARALSKEEYAAQKAQMLQDHAFLSALGLASVWALVGAAQAPSYAAGALLGALYLVLLQKEADAFGAAFIAADDEEERALPAPPPQVVPVLMVLLVGKYNAVLQLLPVLAGFFTSKLATLYQAAYPEGFTPGWRARTRLADKNNPDAYSRKIAACRFVGCCRTVPTQT